jgi:hypothetical protein
MRCGVSGKRLSVALSVGQIVRMFSRNGNSASALQLALEPVGEQR